jgi:hypothetical protein
MPCTQCGRPAFYNVGDAENPHPLCLSCWTVAEQVQMMKWLRSAAMYNDAGHQFDMLAPFGAMHKPLPVAEIARAMTKANTYHNINISNSTVGVVNTGDLAQISAMIEITKGKPTETFGVKLKELIESIANEKGGDEAIKKALAELTKSIGDQVLVERKPSSAVVEALFEKLVSMSSGLTTILGAAEELRAAWQHLVG